MIKTDFGAAKIADYSDGVRDQQLVFTCEHSAKRLPYGLSWGQGEEALEGQHWASDIGALDLTLTLAKHYKTFALYAQYSRLALDVNRVLVSKSMLREQIEPGIQLSFNAKEIVNKVQYKYIFSIHSFSEKDEELKNLEVGILHNLFDPLADQFLAAFKELGYDAKVNQPYDGKLGGNHVQNNSIGFEVDPSRQGILFEFRNDLLVHPEKGPKLRADFIAILDKVLQLKKPPTAINMFPTLPAPQSIVDSFIAENSVVVCYNKEKQVRLAFIAEHAGEDLPYGYSWSVNDQKNIVSKNLHFDKNSRELSIFLAHYFETSLIFTRLSKLVVDANSQLTNNDIFPQKVMGMAVDLNTNLSTEEETRRYERYLMGLVKGILYLHERVSSHFWFSIQGFQADLLPESDLVISFYTNDNFAKKSAEKFIKAGYKVTLNPPMFNGKLLFGYTNLTFLNGFYPRKRESLVFLVSSRQMESNLAKLKSDFSDILKSLCLLSTKS